MPSINNKSDSIISSFVPALLRKQFNEDPSRKPVSELIGDQAVLLWIDICAFSPMSNRLLLDHVNGVERLSKILQSHYDFVLNMFKEFGGEPMVFAGDGVLAAWHCSSEDLPAMAKMAIACGHEILNNKGALDDLGNPLLLHVVTACGPCQLLELGGTDKRWLYTVLGEALNDLQQAAKNREPGKVLVSPAIIETLGAELKYFPANYHSGILDGSAGSVSSPARADLFLSPQAISTLKVYLPKPLSHNLDFEQLKWIDELRPVSIVFTQLHIAGSNSKDAAKLIQNAVKIIGPIVVKYDGILNQVWLDEKSANILIIFGPPPSAHKDNPVRSLRTAIDIKDALGKEGYTNSVGVTSGKAFCGLIGNNIFRQYTVIGDVVNLGSRLAQLQLKNVCCDEPTMKASRDEFVFSLPKMVIIKGLVEKEQIWELESGAAREDNKVTEMPVIGRRNELALFQTCFSRAVSGEAVSLILEGESGLGKSKVLSAFQRNVESGDNLVLTGLGDPVERGIPYFSWRAIFSKLMGLDKSLNQLSKQQVITNFLGDEFADLVSLLNVVFAADFPESETVRSLSVQQKFTETKKLLVQLISRAAEKTPLVIIIDDAVWLDHASWKLAIEVAANVKNCFLLVSVQNTEGIKEIQSLKEAGAIHYKLKGLSEQDQLKLISKALGVPQVPDEINETLISLSKGNPFFCFELIQSLINEQAIIIENGTCKLAGGINLENFPLPETIQGTLSRRIDTLEHGPKLALKVASVTGLRFSTDLIQDIFPVLQERTMVPAFLSKDYKMGLLLQEVIDGEQGYSFNNAITRDVAYEMLLFDQKQELHYEIAEWFENTFEDNLAPFYARLAFHWEKAGENIRAAAYLEKQSVRLFSTGFARQSVDIGLRGVTLLDVHIVREPSEIGQKIGENMAVIAALMDKRSPSDLLSLKKLDDPKVECAINILLRIAPFAFQSQQIDLFALISVSCLRMTLENGSSKDVAVVYSLYSIIYKGMTGDYLGANSWSELAIKADEENGRTLFSNVAFVHTWFHSHWVNPFSYSLPLALSAANAGFASGDILFACFNLSGYVVYLTACGRPLQEVMDFARAHLALNQKRVMNAAFHLILELQFAKALAGETSEYLSLTDEEFNEDQDISSICNTELGNQVGYCLVARVKLHTHFGNWQIALDWAEQVKPLLKAFEGQIAEIDLVQYKAIAALIGVLKGNRKDKDKLIEIASDSLQTMQNWAKMCPVNFKHKALIIQAFLEGVQGGLTTAEGHFTEAEKLAEIGGFLNDSAQLQECKLILQKAEGKELTALEPAIKAYEKWGAFGKAAYLKKLYSQS
ncbi:AAA and adenylate/guanylate cyclase domain-containing protein [Daejeonella oryzae]|uniref:AAA and adenylate/guanylate cyclase domain-containing protein n=1 Tax=Daejeonella oryzae TaxID=1122943 RepID=UPI000402DAC6|nr:AAA and adenylate/guanylate cyclase domain-containing protein [Daejeonella oryzae]